MATVPFGYQGNLGNARRALQKAGNAIGGRMGMAVSTMGAGVAASGDAWRYGAPLHPDGSVRPVSSRIAQYEMGWMSYSNAIYETWALMQTGYTYANAQNTIARGAYPWGPYLQRRGLYLKTMPLYNPVRRLVDFYASHVFPGVLSEDGSTLPDGMALAIPLSKDTDGRLKAAIAQGWWWGNWQSEKALWIRICGATGDGPVEIVDDVERGVLYAEPVWPGEITHLERNGSGDVTAYTREHRLMDEQNQIYTLARVVTHDRIETYRDGSPFSVAGLPAEYDNPYGFAPLVWNSHVNLKAIPGGMAVRNWNKIEKLNSLGSRLHRYIERQAKTPMFLPGQTDVQRVKLDAEMEEELQLLASTGTGVPTTMEGNLDLAQTETRIQSLIAEIEHDHPEVVMYQTLRGMSQVTGPAAEQLMGDVTGYLNDARSGYDVREQRKNGMLVAMGGMRFKEGKAGWADRNSQQRKFAPFGLDSYARGDLEHSIDPRPLMPQTRQQAAETKMSIAAGYSAMANAGQPLDFQIGPWGEDWDAKMIGDLHAAQDEAAQKALEQVQAMNPADDNMPDGAQTGERIGKRAQLAASNAKTIDN